MTDPRTALRIVGAGLSDVGLKRQGNEDSFSLSPQHNLFVVADGMGGHAAGEVASRLAVESIERHIVGNDPRKEPTLPAAFRTPRRDEEQMAIPARRVLNAIRLANQEITRSVRRNSSQRGMGTTVVLAYIRGSRAYIGSVGDSRAYLLRDATIRQLTSDHTFVNEQVRAGTLTLEEARRHPARNILTRAVGSQEDVDADLIEQDLKAGDALLLCTDGLTTMAEDADILAAVRSRGDDLEACCRALVELANSRGGDDNVTVVLVKALPPAG
ncbi:MAG TPA: Stp1/IreP family PP2C-type Ser/Thr phosphatase [Candidatus Polarisedimenticolia bacterium]|nr:Stp1/IreP family PP2C-type Ser/Thr phosphatase [Candidatus Polarisedimenticolia bacterium]